MLLLYDHKCNLCRDLAYKIHINTRKEVAIKSLSDPETLEILHRFYPAGWSHDFYVIDEDVCAKGVRALTKLLRPLGARGMIELLSEYSAFKLSRKTTARQRNGHQASRRKMLKYAALAPVISGLSKLSLADPYTSTSEDFRVHIARVTANGSTGWNTECWRCEECIQSTPTFKQGRMDVKQSGRITVLKDTSSAFVSSAGVANLKIIKTDLTAEVFRDKVPVERDMTIYAAILDHSRFKISFNVGNGPVKTTTGDLDKATTVSALITHDLPIANVDVIGFESSYQLNATYYPEAYTEGIKSLAGLHQKNGSNSLSRLYGEIAASMSIVKSELSNVVPDDFVPIHSKGIITSLPQLMKFVDVPSSLVHFGNTIQGGCDAGCKCNCSACCGCGCGFGLELCTDGDPCGCGCCIGCACDCSICCGVS